jgi:hypothetical protein
MLIESKGRNFPLYETKHDYFYYAAELKSN